MEIASSGEPDSGNKVGAMLLKGFLCVYIARIVEVDEIYVFYVELGVARYSIAML